MGSVLSVSWFIVIICSVLAGCSRSSVCLKVRMIVCMFIATNAVNILIAILCAFH